MHAHFHKTGQTEYKDKCINNYQGTEGVEVQIIAKHLFPRKVIYYKTLSHPTLRLKRKLFHLQYAPQKIKFMPQFMKFDVITYCVSKWK